MFLARSRPTVVISIVGDSKLVLRDSTILALRRREREPSTPSAFGLRRGKADVRLEPLARQTLMKRGLLPHARLTGKNRRKTTMLARDLALAPRRSPLQRHAR